MNLGCLFPDFDYVDSVYFYTLWPLGASIILMVLLPVISALIQTMQTEAKFPDAYKKSASAFATLWLILTFLVFVSTSTALFTFFKVIGWHPARRK